MWLTVLKSKLHQACITHTELLYEGSCAIDEELLKAAGISPYEQIEIYNIDNGERFTTYALSAPPGSRMISLRGAAAHKGKVHERVIICAYAMIEPSEITYFKPTICLLKDNRVQSSV
ncbi:MAG: aspartate 1-decarboxylase [Gammaproteobacteria bacterium]|nr:aspartate 1-decarboxylase [Gammaproteobacteria bacterium]